MGETAALAEERARIQGQLPGWDVWWVPIAVPRGTRWCGRPAGHPVSVAQGDSGDELIKNARAWTEQQGSRM